MNLADPATHDEAELDAKVDEVEREIRWDEFVTWVRQGRVSVILKHVADLMDERFEYRYGAVQSVIMNFADAEGWPAVLSAIARAMHADERIDQAVGK